MNCTHNIPNHHEGLFKYFNFPVGKWRQHQSDSDPEKLKYFINTYLDFIRDGLETGDTILVHCLAGAHRAGTAAIIALMFLLDLDKSQALKAAQTARPVIEPIGSLAELLGIVENYLKHAKQFN